MSSAAAGGFRASIPSTVRKTIQNIKEIAANHSDEDIYSMLKECSMDPNETTQKLLLQDTFHEVKRKRDKRKENLNNREPVEPRGRPGTQGRGLRGGRRNFSPHKVSQDAGGSKTSVRSRDNGAHKTSEKVVPPLSASQEITSKGKSYGTKNHSAETLYGWKDYEIIGQRVADFLVAVEYYASLQKILERLIAGVPWSGQFPFKKRSGEVFMALVTKTPLYEDGELVGVITVSTLKILKNEELANLVPMANLEYRG